MPVKLAEVLDNGTSCGSRSARWGYETAHLPVEVCCSLAFWRLPHNVRRLVYFACAIGGDDGFNELLRGRRGLPHVRNLRRRFDNGSHREGRLRPFLRTGSIFVHIPKTAGLAIQASIYGRKTGEHRTIRDYMLVFPKSEFDSLFKFAFVRNPWDRALSAYLYLRNGGRSFGDRRWARWIANRFDDFSGFLKGGIGCAMEHGNVHFRPQLEFLRGVDRSVAVDYVGKYENIRRDYAIIRETIRETIGVGGDLNVVNKGPSRPRHYRDYYTTETRRIIDRVYSCDIEAFDYKF